MHHFTYHDDRLFAEDIDLTALAEQIGTPFYLYSEATLRRHISVFRDAFKDTNALIAYSVKANSNLAVLKVLASEDAGADVVSGGELQRALKAGIPPEKIVFSGVGKTVDEITMALNVGIYQFNVESEPELNAINALAGGANKKAPIALRINPDVAAGGHEKISTGKSEDKFGIPWSQARELYAKARAMEAIAIKGVDLHIGSQIDNLAPFETAFKKIAALIDTLRADGCAIERLDLGGGLGIPYGEGAAPPHPDAYAQMIKQVTAPLNVQLIFEPGRMIAGNAGILVTRTTYVKNGEERKFLILDAAMNDLIRPALYDAYHDIWPVVREPETPLEKYDVVGPICESSDRFAKARELPAAKPGDLFAIMSAGAYGASQTSQYNSRPLVPEILVSGERYSVIRRRPDFETMIAGEEIPDWLG
ncbi:MAG: diaminopimelate decarboxylase [Hyphococcus sp.]|nr:MAG: diaminopimelate decarboxylase [Marinicaulis sp.]